MASGDDSDVEYSHVREPSDQDTADESLTEETKRMLENHESKRANVFRKTITPTVYRSGTSTPDTVKRAMSTSSDATPVAAAFSEGTLLVPPSRTVYLSVAETKEENKRLKAEVFDLKAQLYVLKKDLPKILNNEGKDFCDEYLSMRAELDNERVRRAELEQICQSQKKKFDEERAKFDNEKSDWDMKREKLLLDKDELETELKELRRQLSEKTVEREDGSESQGDSSVSNISLMSERGMEMERLRSLIFQQGIDQKKLQMKMENEIAELQNQLEHTKDDLAKQNARCTEEKIRCETLKAEVAKLQQLANNALQEVENQKQVSEQQLATAYAENEIALNKRDRTIRILLKKLKSDGAETPSKSKIEENISCSQRADIPNLNPYAQGILDQVDEFAAENEAIRKKVIELGVHDVVLMSGFESSEGPTTEDESSEWNTRRCERENEKLAAFLAQNRTVPDGTSEEELGGNLALFDAISGDVPQRENLKENLEDTTRSMGASEMLNITSAADLLSKSLVLSEDLGEVKKKISILQSVCTRLFEKLRGTANFLQTLLDELGADDRGRELLAQIEALRIDLDQSLTTAADISRDIEAAEESIGDLSAQLQRSMNCSFGILSVPSNENQQNASALSRAHAACKRVNVELANEKMKTNEFKELNEQLQARIAGLEESKKKIADELDKLKRDVAIKENEMASSFKDMETQLQHKNQQCDELYEQAEELRQIIEMKEAEVAEKDAEMQRGNDQLNEKCRHLEIQIAETNHALELKNESVKKLRNDIERGNEKLTARNSELAHYRAEIIELDSKVCELISAAKKYLGNVDEEADKPIVGAADSETAALAQLAQIGTDLDEFAKIVHYTADLRNQVVALQQNLDLCERSCTAVNAKCRGLTDQIAYIETERDECKQKLQILEQRMHAEQESLRAAEKNLQLLKTENTSIKENNERLAKILAGVEAKYDELTAKQNRSSLSDDRHQSQNYTVTTGTMTSLSACDLIELTDKMKKFTSFAKRMYTLAEQWNEEGVGDPGISYKSVDLDHLYHTYARILKHLSDELSELRNRIALNNAQLLSMGSEEQQDRWQSGSSKSNEVEVLGTPSFSTRDESGSELVLVDSRAVYSTVDGIVQRLKAILNNPQKTEVVEVLSNMRSLRSQIAALLTQSQQLEKMKENVAPVETFKRENARLSAALDNATAMLQQAHEKLNKLPNSKEMCEQILLEMNKISEAMKASSRAVGRLGIRTRAAKSSEGNK